jgi:hypothetical protein
MNDEVRDAAEAAIRCARIYAQPGSSLQEAIDKYDRAKSREVSTEPDGEEARLREGMGGGETLPPMPLDMVALGPAVVLSCVGLMVFLFLWAFGSVGSEWVVLMVVCCSIVAAWFAYSARKYRR